MALLYPQFVGSLTSFFSSARSCSAMSSLDLAQSLTLRLSDSATRLGGSDLVSAVVFSACLRSCICSVLLKKKLRLCVANVFGPMRSTGGPNTFLIASVAAAWENAFLLCPMFILLGFTQPPAPVGFFSRPPAAFLSCLYPDKWQITTALMTSRYVSAKATRLRLLGIRLILRRPEKNMSNDTLTHPVSMDIYGFCSEKWSGCWMLCVRRQISPRICYRLLFQCLKPVGSNFALQIATYFGNLWN